MATPFVRIDLSDAARDFRPIALEPGLPLLDRSGSNAKILFRWLGGRIAEPVWGGESVNFFVRDDQGGRLEEVVCQPATGEDLQGMLKGDLATLKSRLEKARPETPTERTLLKAAVQSLAELTAEPGRPDVDCYFFRYRDVQGRWRLVWCWGYQRRDQQPAPAVVCTDPDCNLLFVRRPGKSPKCPSCAAALPIKPAKSRSWGPAAVMLLLLLLLAGAVIFWQFRPTALTVPAEKVAVEPGKRADIEPREDAPADVKILSDQGTAVRLPVGAAFDDFRVEALYADGITQIVTKKATLKTPDPPQTAPVAAADGRLLGVRPGRTAVQAEYGGVGSQQPLEVEVTAEMDLDEIRLVPAPATLLPGETIALEAVGYKGGKSLGAITGSEKLAWQSSPSAVAQVNGPLVTALSVGQATVTAALGSTSSQPATVNVVASIDDPLVPSPKIFHLQVGESALLGSDVVVLRGQTDVSGQCSVRPALPSVVRFAPETHSLVGVAPGTSAVALALGDKVANLMVEVLPQSGPVEGTVVIEPKSGNVAPGQALPLRVYVVAATGERTDRTDAAVLSSSDPAKVKILGNRACAVAPGSAEITASLPGVEKSDTAEINVNDEQISGLLVDPARLDMSVDDAAQLRILGRAASGTYEMFPQPDLALSVGGSSRDAVRVDGAGQVTAISPGKADVKVAWRDRLSQQVPVTVTDSPLTDLRLEPAQATIHPDQPLLYQVTAMRGGHRRVLGADSGLQLSVADKDVAEAVGPLVVRGVRPGRTVVVARVGEQRAEATLEVAAEGTPIAVETVVDIPGMGIIGDWRRIWQDGKPEWKKYWERVGKGIYVERRPDVVSPPSLGDPLSIDPSEITLQVGQTTPPLRVTAQGPSGAPYEVPAALKSMDPNVLAPDALGRFVAKGFGSTQLRAEYGGREAFAKVTVTGNRFMKVNAQLNEGKENFDVSLEVLAAKSEGPLEYRVYEVGQSPAETWMPAEVQDEFRRVSLRSPAMPYRPRGTLYHLMIEARNAGGGTIQQYPLTFRLKEDIELKEGGEQR